MDKILVDTGIFIALFNKIDKYHDKAISFIRDQNMLPFTTEAVITEVVFIFHSRVDVQYDFLRLMCESNIEVITFSGSDYLSIAELMKKYSDLPMDYADATVVRACEIVDSRLVATVDSDFTIYKFKGQTPFTNVIETL
jgi:hypothetical protein